MCLWAQSVTAGSAPSAPTNPDIASDFVAGGIEFSWTNPATPGMTNEIWKSTDDTTYVLFSTVGGGVTSINDNTLIPNGSTWYYKVRSCNGSSCSAFTTPVGVAFNYTSPNVASISFPHIIRVIGSFTATPLAALTSVSLPVLKTVQSTLDLSNNPNLTSINLNSLQSILTGNLFLGGDKITGAFSLPALTSVASDLQIQSNTLMTSFSAALLTGIGGNFVISGCTGMTSVTLTNLAGVTGRTDFNGDTALTTLSLPAFGTANDEIDFYNCTALTSVSLPSLITLNATNIFTMRGDSCTLLTSLSIPQLTNLIDGFTFDVSNCALNAASINQILARGVVAGVTTTTFTLNLGTNAAPSGQGVIDKATLIGLGNVVNTN
jgi:hypothetical protein